MAEVSTDLPIAVALAVVLVVPAELAMQAAHTWQQQWLEVAPLLRAETWRTFEQRRVFLPAWPRSWRWDPVVISHGVAHRVSNAWGADLFQIDEVGALMAPQLDASGWQGGVLGSRVHVAWRTTEREDGRLWFCVRLPQEDSSPVWSVTVTPLGRAHIGELLLALVRAVVRDAAPGEQGWLSWALQAPLPRERAALLAAPPFGIPELVARLTDGGVARPDGRWRR